MKEYERLTKQKWSNDIDLTQELGYSYIYKRLYELEDKIENGTLIEAPKDKLEVMKSIARSKLEEYKKYEFDGKCDSYNLEIYNILCARIEMLSELTLITQDECKEAKELLTNKYNEYLRNLLEVKRNLWVVKRNLRGVKKK